MVGQVAGIILVRELDAEGEGVVEPSPHTSSCSCPAAVVVSGRRERGGKQMLFTSRCAYQAARRKIRRRQSPAELGGRTARGSAGHSQSRVTEGWDHSPRKITSINASFC